MDSEYQKLIGYSWVCSANNDKNKSIKIDYFLSYNFNLQGNITFEPSIGYTRSTFVIMNEENTGSSFSIPKTGGILVGISSSKHFTVNYNEFLSVFGNVEYALFGYSKSEF